MGDSLNALALFLGPDHLAPVMAYVFELAGRGMREGECYDPCVMGLLVRDNSQFFEWLRIRGESFPSCY